MTHDATRRRFLVVTGALAAGSLPFDGAFTQELPATPVCHDGDAATLRQTEGPFFKPKSPERGSRSVTLAPTGALALIRFSIVRIAPTSRSCSGSTMWPSIAATSRLLRVSSGANALRPAAVIASSVCRASSGETSLRISPRLWKPRSMRLR